MIFCSISDSEREHRIAQEHSLNCVPECVAKTFANLIRHKQSYHRFGLYILSCSFGSGMWIKHMWNSSPFLRASGLCVSKCYCRYLFYEQRNIYVAVLYAVLIYELKMYTNWPNFRSFTHSLTNGIKLHKLIKKPSGFCNIQLLLMFSHSEHHSSSPTSKYQFC